MGPEHACRSWLGNGQDAGDRQFSLGLGQGFGCEFQTLGAVLGLAEALGGEEALRQQVHAVSGASSGAKIAALVASPVPLEHAARALCKIRAREIFFVRSGVSLSAARACSRCMSARVRILGVRGKCYSPGIRRLKCPC